MSRQTLREFGAEAADVTAAFFGRNAVVIAVLVTFALVVLARP